MCRNIYFVQKLFFFPPFISQIYFEFKKFRFQGNAALANKDLRGTVFKRKGELYQLLMVSLLCPEFLPAEHWRGRWGTHAACRENVRGSQSSPRRPEPAPLQGTFGSLSRSLDREEREGNYKKKKELTLQKKTTAVGQTEEQQWKVHKIPVIPPILSMTEPSTRPEHVSNTRTLLPAWMFASVRIWASVSYRRWLHHTETNCTSNLSALLKNTI